MSLDYDEVYSLKSDWSFLPSFDHPDEPARCLVSGTGLTHLASAANRDAMHAAATITDSMRMYNLGVEQGRPAPGETGAAPEWFYKGNGTILRGHGAPLAVPSFAGDGGEEPELAAVYVIDLKGTPRRLGMTPANEFSDHQIEKQNYLYLAHSKLRTCAIGPELILDPDFSLVAGTVTISVAAPSCGPKKFPLATSACATRSPTSSIIISNTSPTAAPATPTCISWEQAPSVSEKESLLKTAMK